MAKNRTRRDSNTGRRLAYLAARLMAEEGAADFAAAKLKAARQAGIGDAATLPDNREIEEALRLHQELYQKASQPGELRRLREVAVKVMRELVDFRPTLVGAVLTGTANRYSEVSLQLYADDPKALALFLVNRRLRFDQSEQRLRTADGWKEVPRFRLEVEGVPVVLAVYPRLAERNAGRSPRDADGVARAGLAGVEALLGH